MNKTKQVLKETERLCEAIDYELSLLRDARKRMAEVSPIMLVDCIELREKVISNLVLSIRDSVKSLAEKPKRRKKV